MGLSKSGPLPDELDPALAVTTGTFINNPMTSIPCASVKVFDHRVKDISTPPKLDGVEVELTDEAKKARKKAAGEQKQ